MTATPTIRLRHRGWRRHLRAGAALVAAVAGAACGRGAPDSGAGRATVERQRDAAVAEAAAAPVPAPAALRREGTLTAADRRAWHARLHWPDACEAAFRASQAGDDAGIAFTSLGPAITLVDVVCAAGAYQPSHVFVRLDERGSSPIASVLDFPTYASEDGRTVQVSTGAELWGETLASPERRELAVLTLSRQTADCGIWVRYAVGGERPSLLGAAAKLPCPPTPGPPAVLVSDRAPRGWRPVTPAH